MGILSDTLEDNKERFGQLLSPEFWPTSLSTITIPLPRTICCPLCTEWFAGEDGLRKHILSIHRHLQAYLRFNGRVIQDLAYTEEPIEDVLIVVLGEQKATVSMRLEGEVRDDIVVEPGRPEQIAALLPSDFVGVICIAIAFGQFRREYTLYRRTQPRIEIDALDSGIRSFQESLVKDEEPNWNVFRHTLQAPDRHAIESRYLEGFFEYILGSYMELRKNLRAGAHFERAFGLLRPFATSMAHTARCLLAIKLNWFHLLAVCGPQSKFYGANIFFNSGFKEALRFGPKENPNFRDSSGVWMDSFTEMALEAVGWFFLEDSAKLESILAELEKNFLVSDRNNFDKLTFIKARRLRRLCQADAAEQNYRYLLYHPIFKSEAEEFCVKRRNT